MGNVFSHSGDIGDLLAHLPLVRQAGGGELVLFPADCTGRRMTRGRFDGLRPFLALQPYLTAVRYADGPAGVNLDRWRQRYRGHLNLTDMAAEAFGLPHPDRDRPWLRVDRVDRVARVLFARSHRYRNPRVDWSAIYRAYAGQAAFVGTADEHRDFVASFGPVPHHPTGDYLQLARAVAGADLVAVNQTSIRWLAEGLKVPVLVEVDAGLDNTHWQREGAFYLYGAGDPVPPLDDLEGVAVRVAVRRGRGHTPLGDGRLAALARLARAARRRAGLLAEAGCRRGGAAAVLAAACPEKVLRRFDGGAAGGVGEVLRLAAVETVGGRPADDAQYALVHLAGDAAGGAADVVYFAPRLAAGGVLVLTGAGADGPDVGRAASAAGLTALDDPAGPAWLRG